MNLENIDAFRESDSIAPGGHFRCKVRGNLLRTADGKPRKFRTLKAACDAGKEAEAHAMANHALWEADKATADRLGISVPEANACRKDTLVMISTLARVAVADAFRRMMRAAMGGLSSDDWRLWIRPMVDGQPSPLFIGPEAPGPEWMAWPCAIDSASTEDQLRNRVRFALDNAPLWAVSFPTTDANA